MRLKNRILSVMVLLLSLPAMASAIPAQSNNCVGIASQIVYPRGGKSSLLFSEDCKTAYVAPPPSGKVTINNYSISANLAFCPAVLGMHRKRLTLNRNIDKAMAKIEAMQDNDVNSPDELNSWLTLHNNLVGLAQNAEKDFLKYSGWEALTAHVLYELPWTKLIKKYQDANRHLNLNWVRLPIISARITWSALSNSGDGANAIPALLYANIPGMKVSPAIPDGTTKIEDIDSKKFNSAHNMIVGGGDAFSGQIALSLTGACQLFDAKSEDFLQRSLDVEKLSAHLVTNVYYSFPVLVRRHYSIEYNVERLVERLEKMTSHGGFLSASNIHSLVESGDGKDWVDIDYGSNDVSMNYSPEERSLIAHEVKLELINRVLQSIAVPGGDINPPAMPEQPKGGFASSNIFTLGSIFGCSWLPICFTPNWVLLGLESIFGSKNAISNFKRVNRGWGKETINGAQTVERTTQVTFKLFSPRSSDSKSDL